MLTLKNLFFASSVLWGSFIGGMNIYGIYDMHTTVWPLENKEIYYGSVFSFIKGIGYGIFTPITLPWTIVSFYKADELGITKKKLEKQLFDNKIKGKNVNSVKGIILRKRLTDPQNFILYGLIYPHPIRFRTSTPMQIALGL